jgi:hypothetical protein
MVRSPKLAVNCDARFGFGLRARTRPTTSNQTEGVATRATSANDLQRGPSPALAEGS